jgi:hypothetical protein
MKAITVIFLGFVMVGVFFILHLDKKESMSLPDPIATDSRQNSVVTAKVDSFPETSVSRSKPRETKIWVVDEKKLQAGNKELTEIIEEFDSNLDNPEKREELKVRLSQVAEMYKQEVLAKVKSTLQNQNN